MKSNYFLTSAFLCLLVLMCSIPSVNAQMTITGTVFHDENENQLFDSEESGIAGVLISNGGEITETDNRGAYSISVEENSVLFVIKPRGWQNPSNQNNIPQFFAVNSSEGATGSVYDGLTDTE